jgi:hypothetical protein
MSAAPLPRPEPRKGFSPLPNECLWDWSRLASGDAQVLSILFINAELNPPRDRGVPPPKETRAITDNELAAFARCTVRALQIARDDLVARKVITAKKSGVGAFRYGIPWETWSGLPDRPSKVVSIAEAEQADDVPDDDPSQPRGEVLKVFTKPQRVRAGGRTRPKELPRAAGKVQFEAENEIEFDARMCDGVLTVRAKSGEQPANATRKKGERIGNTFPKRNSQVAAKSTNGDFSSLHSLLDDYCLTHHGTIPNDKLLSKISQALGKTSIDHYKRVIHAKMRTRKIIAMGLFIDLARDATAGAIKGSPVEYDQMGRPRRAGG